MRYTARDDMMFFRKKRGNNQYFVFGVREGYDTNMDPDDQKELYECWERTDALYQMICEYYENDNSAMCYLKDDVCESEEEQF